jgi:hypothetical protein
MIIIIWKDERVLMLTAQTQTFKIKLAYDNNVSSNKQNFLTTVS